MSLKTILNVQQIQFMKRKNILALQQTAVE